MKTSIFRNILVSLMLTGAAACGGGGGGSSPPPDDGGGPPPPSGNVVSITTNASWVACQDGKGSTWNVLDPNNTGVNTFRCTVTDPAGEYGVAVALTRNATVAGGTVERRDVEILHGTVAEATTVNLVYEKLNIPMANITIDVTNSSSGFVNVAIDEIMPLTFTGDGTQNTTIEEGTWDLVGFEIDTGTGDVTGNIFLQRAVTVSDGQTYTVDFSQATIPSNTLTDHAFQVTASEGGVATLVTENYTVVPIMDTLGMTWTSLDSGLNSKDRYAFFAGHQVTDDSGNQYGYIWMRVATADPAVPNPGDIQIDLTTRPMVTVTSLDRNTVSWQAYMKHDASPPLRAYGLLLNQGDPELVNSITWDITMTVGWLGSNAAYTYTVPDLVNEAGLPGAYALDSTQATNANFSVTMFNVATYEMAASFDPIAFPDLVIETAEHTSLVAPAL